MRSATGTGSVILGGFTNAARLNSKASGRPLSDQRILFFGAGSAGVGVAKQLCAFFTRQGLSQDEARRRIWLVDSKGLITNDRGDKLAEHKVSRAAEDGGSCREADRPSAQVYFSRDDNEGKQYKGLLDVINYVKPTALIGLSTVPKTFTEEILARMAELNPRPIVFPLSNVSTQLFWPPSLCAVADRLLLPSHRRCPSATLRRPCRPQRARSSLPPARRSPRRTTRASISFRARATTSTSSPALASPAHWQSADASATR